MGSKNIEFRVGVIILLGVIILGGSLYWLQGYKLATNSRIISVLFDDVGTLSVGDRVTVSGVRKGNVSDLRLSGRGVEVELLINREVILKSDALFVIKNLGLMGERFIAISPGKEEVELDYTKTAIGLYDTGLPEVMGLLGDMITELRNLVVSFKRTVGSDSSLQTFNNTIKNFEQVSSSLVGYISRNEENFDKTVDNFLGASKELNRLFSENAGRVDSTIFRIERASVRMEKIAAQLDTLSVSAREFADNINNPDGTMQLLLEDRRLYDDLRRTADNIDDLVSDIRANPRKYINLTVEIF